MSTCYPTPYTDKEKPYGSANNPFGAKIIQVEPKEYCEVDIEYLLQENGNFILQENGDKIIL